MHILTSVLKNGFKIFGVQRYFASALYTGIHFISCAFCFFEVRNVW